MVLLTFSRLYRMRRQRNSVNRRWTEISTTTKKSLTHSLRSGTIDDVTTTNDSQLDMGGFDVVGGLVAGDQGGPVIPSLSVRVAAVDRWAVRAQTWLSDAANTAAKPDRYTDVIGPFD